MNLTHTLKVTFVSAIILILGSLIPSVDLLSQTYSLQEVKENLYRERPQTGDLEIRKLSQNVIDEFASYRFFDKTGRKYLLVQNKADLEIQLEIFDEFGGEGILL